MVSEEFLVRFRYWLVSGGMMILSVWGIMISFKVFVWVKLRDIVVFVCLWLIVLILECIIFVMKDVV